MPSENSFRAKRLATMLPLLCAAGITLVQSGIAPPASRAQAAEAVAPAAGTPPVSEDPATPSVIPGLPPNTVSMAPIVGAGDRASPSVLRPAAAGIRPVGPVLSENDHVLFQRANDAADHNDWLTARSLAAQGADPIAQRIIEWRYLLDDGAGAGFDAISNFLYQYPNWPRRDALLIRAERAMPPDLPADQVIAWYGGRAPSTSDGAMRLGEAMIAAGRRADGAGLIRKTWIGNLFSPADEARILGAHGDVLSAADQRQRLNVLLAGDATADARRQMMRVDAASAKLADARLKMRANPSLAANIPSMLDPAQRNDPGLLFDKAHALRLSHADEEAWATILGASVAKDTLPAPGQWWAERHIMARDAIKNGEPEIAYQLASNHHLESGGGFADAEWLSGWIALRYLNKPDVALQHFTRLANGVGLPISRARAYYWLARAQEALGRDADAIASYRKAGQDSTTYYGQLALARVQPAPNLRLAAHAGPTAAQRAKFEADDRVQAMRILGDLNQRILLRIFALAMASQSSDPGELALLGDLTMKLGDPLASLRAGKFASYQNAIFPDVLDPIVELPRQPTGVNLEPAFVLGIMRQESEFDSDAISTAGARGLMQIMPGGARGMAQSGGLPYRPTNLNDPTYNTQLGMTHLSDFVAQWGGSYILAAASYNAGPGNVRNWIATYGDPRDAGIDPVDWVELIPFGETRNYVQRVLENIQVYRSRLGGNGQRLAIMMDLYRPQIAPAVSIRLAAPAQPAAPATQEATTVRPKPNEASIIP